MSTASPARCRRSTASTRGSSSCTTGGVGTCSASGSPTRSWRPTGTCAPRRPTSTTTLSAQGSSVARRTGPGRATGGSSRAREESVAVGRSRPGRSVRLRGAPLQRSRSSRPASRRRRRRRRGSPPPRRTRSRKPKVTVVTGEQIAERAYYIWADGSGAGAFDDWIRAERGSGGRVAKQAAGTESTHHRPGTRLASLHGEGGSPVRMHGGAATPPDGGSANARAATRSARSSRRRPPRSGAAGEPLLRLVDVDAEEATRISTGVPELDRVLGGGLVPASLVLVGRAGRRQVDPPPQRTRRRRAGRPPRAFRHRRGIDRAGETPRRLGGTEQVEILAETELDAVCATLERERPDVCVIDSIQTLYAADMGSARARSDQVRERPAGCSAIAKEHNVATILVGHVTKDGADAARACSSTSSTACSSSRAIATTPTASSERRRTGSTNELGVFEMTGQGSSVCRTRPSSSARYSRARSAQRSPARWKGRDRSCSRSRRSWRPPTWRCRAASARVSTRSGSRWSPSSPPRRSTARRRRRLRQRRRRAADRRAGRRPRDRARDRLRRPRRAGAGGDRRVRRRSASPAACGRRRIGAAARGVRQARRPRRGRTRGNEESLADPGLRLGHVARRSACRARGEKPRKSA